MLLFLASRQSMKLIVGQREMKKSALVKEIVEASIVENKPTPLPGSPLPAALICKIEALCKLNLNSSKNTCFSSHPSCLGEKKVYMRSS